MCWNFTGLLQSSQMAPHGLPGLGYGIGRNVQSGRGGRDQSRTGGADMQADRADH